MRRYWWISLLLLIPIVLFFGPGREGLPDFAAVRAAFQSSDQKILDRHGRLLLSHRLDPKARRLDWLPLGDIAPIFLQTLVKIEDQRFYEHHGIDLHALLALITQKRGGSSLSMQLVAQLNPALKAQGKFRRPWQKLLQLRAAWVLERSWSKAEILEAYVNLVSFRGELQGLGAASQALMQKAAHGLNAEESLLLVTALGLPTARAEVIAARACRLRIAVAIKTSCELIERLGKRTLDRAPQLRTSVRLAPHLAALTNREEQVVRTTLDAHLQETASQALQSHLAALVEQNVHDGAVLVVDNSSAEVLAYVGSSAATTQNLFVDMVRARRQAGSSLKPLLYGLAIDQRLITAASLLDDVPLSLPTANGLYVPKNYDEKYQGAVTVREALASSLNIPAVRVIDMVGVPNFVALLRSIGFTQLADTGNYGHSLALGAADITPWELAGAYLSLASGGIFRPLKLFAEGPGTAGQKWLSEESAFIVGSILSSRSARALTFGLENPLATPFWTAVKTGTSKDMRDNWCAGFSSRYTVVVWVGNADGSPMWNVTGVSGAAPVWRDVMNSLHAQESSEVPPAPPGLLAHEYRDMRGRLQKDWFLKGTEPVQQKLADRRFGLKILHPSEGTLIAFDPDIPEAQQALFFEATGALPKGGRWVLDQKTLPADHIRLSQLEGGRHRLEIQNKEGHALDAVQFELRGRALQVSQSPR